LKEIDASDSTLVPDCMHIINADIELNRLMCAVAAVSEEERRAAADCESVSVQRLGQECGDADVLR